MKVSICIPAYNNEVSLKRCLDSVLIQDFEDYEIVITDDSPSNVIAQLVSGYNNSKIHYYKNTENLGSPENWNRALSLAKGEYIKIMHHDDWFSSDDSLGKFVALLETNPTVLFAASSCNDIFNETCIAKRVIREKDKKRIEKNPYYLFSGNYLGAPSVVLFRNNNNVLFDKKLVWLVDIDFYINILLKNSNLVTTQETLVNIGISADQITRKCENNRALILSEYIYLFNKLKTNSIERRLWLVLLRQFSKNQIFSNKDLSVLFDKENVSIDLSFTDSCIIRVLYIENTVISYLKTAKKHFVKIWK